MRSWVRRVEARRLAAGVLGVSLAASLYGLEVGRDHVHSLTFTLLHDDHQNTCTAKRCLTGSFANEDELAAAFAEVAHKVGTKVDLHQLCTSHCSAVYLGPEVDAVVTAFELKASTVDYVAFVIDVKLQPAASR